MFAIDKNLAIFAKIGRSTVTAFEVRNYITCQLSIEIEIWMMPASIADIHGRLHDSYECSVLCCLTVLKWWPQHRSNARYLE